MAKIVKDEKIRCFFVEERREKPFKTLTRHFIHTEESGGFWAALRDISQNERLANDAIGNQTVVNIIVGYNPRILKDWEKLTIIDERGQTYAIKTKPDEYMYDKTDLKIVAYAFRDSNSYSDADIYENGQHS